MTVRSAEDLKSRLDAIVNAPNAMTLLIYMTENVTNQESSCLIHISVVDNALHEHNFEFKALGNARNGYSHDHIFDLVIRNASIKRLGINDKIPHQSGFGQLNRLLKEKTTLKCLELESEKLTDAVVKQIYDGLYKNKHLKCFTAHSDSLTFVGGNVFFKAMLANPYFSLEEIDIESLRISERLKNKIHTIAMYNYKLRIRKQGNIVVRRPVHWAEFNCLRCYDLTEEQLDTVLFQLSLKEELVSIRHVFIYNTPMNYAFRSKWFNKGAIGPNLDTLSVINCEADDPNNTPYREYFMQPEFILSFPQIDILHIQNV